MSQHVCHADGCQVAVPSKMFMCRKHWFELPVEMRNEVEKHYRPGQRFAAGHYPSKEWLVAARIARRYLYEKRQNEAQAGEAK